MSVTVDISEAGQQFHELLSKAEAGEEVIISRGNDPIAKLTKISRDADVKAAIEEIIASRKGRPSTTAEEILAWKEEGRRY